MPLLAAAGMASGCATSAGQDPPAVAAATTETCVRTTGSNICRKADSVGMDNSVSITGEALQRMGGSMTGPRPNPIGD